MLKKSLKYSLKEIFNGITEKQTNMSYHLKQYGSRYMILMFIKNKIYNKLFNGMLLKKIILHDTATISAKM